MSLTFASISAAWIRNGHPLPACCTLHGAPATSTRKLTIWTPAPNWLLALVIVGVLPFLIANYTVRKRIHAVAWPFCDRCRSERLLRLGKGWAVFAAGVALFFAMPQNSDSANLIGGAAVLALLFGVFLLRRGLWRHVAGASLTPDLQRVLVQPAHTAFADTVPAAARAAVPTPGAARPR